MDNFGNADKNSGRMEACSWYSYNLILCANRQPYTETPKDSLDLTNALKPQQAHFLLDSFLPFFSKASTHWLISSPIWVLFVPNIWRRIWEMSVHYQLLPDYNTWVRRHHNFILGWNTSASIKHTCPENTHRIPSLPSKFSNRVF